MMHGWITVHDSFGKTRRSAAKRPPRPMRVRASSIDSIRPYGDGVTRAVLGIHGSFLHISETEAEIERMILDAERVLE